MVDWRTFPAPARGATLAAQSTGDDDDPVIVLHYGATGSRDWWPDEFCGLVVGSGFRVIRYDPRDTGESTHSPSGEPDYSSGDLTEDVIAVLDAAGVERAILVGLSMGGGIAQSVAARHPSRTSGLVLMSTTAAFPVDVDLPPPTLAFDATPPDPDWTDRDAVIAWAIEAEQPYAGPGMLDEDGIRLAVGRTWDRDADMSTASNHWIAIENDDGESLEAAALRRLPGFVVHGSADPLFPLPHGEALAAALDMPLMVLDGVGHQLPPRPFWPEIVERFVTLRTPS